LKRPVTALALWDYNEQSVYYLFGKKTGNPKADEILEALEATSEGLTRTGICNLFHNNADKDRIDDALECLVDLHLAHPVAEGKATRWFAGPLPTK
jgi:hypothetical protein